jgi:hypothetical protein
MLRFFLYRRRLLLLIAASAGFLFDRGGPAVNRGHCCRHGGRRRCLGGSRISLRPLLNQRLLRRCLLLLLLLHNRLLPLPRRWRARMRGSRRHIANLLGWLLW